MLTVHRFADTLQNTELIATFEVSGDNTDIITPEGSHNLPLVPGKWVLYAGCELIESLDENKGEPWVTVLGILVDDGDNKSANGMPDELIDNAVTTDCGTFRLRGDVRLTEKTADDPTGHTNVTDEDGEISFNINGIRYYSLKMHTAPNGKMGSFMVEAFANELGI